MFAGLVYPDSNLWIIRRLNLGYQYSAALLHAPKMDTCPVA